MINFGKFQKYIQQIFVDDKFFPSDIITWNVKFYITGTPSVWRGMLGWTATIYWLVSDERQINT